MTLPQSVEPPSLYVTALPEPEREAGLYIMNNLRSLSASYKKFLSAVELYDFVLHKAADTNNDFANEMKTVNWRLIAARDGAIMLSSVFKVMQAISGKLLIRCPTIANVFDQTIRKDAYKLFNTYFPRIVNLRDAAAHPAEFSSTPASMADHASTTGNPSLGIIIESGPLLVEDCMINGAYVSTYEKTFLSYRPEAATVRQLHEVLTRYFDAFDLADMVLRARINELGAGVCERTQR